MKKMLKVLLLIVLVIGMLVVLAGCGSNTKIETESQEQTKEFSLGEWNESVYTNDFLGLKFNLPEGWIYSSQEEMKQMMETGADIVTDSELQQKVAELTSAYYLMATDPATGNNVILMSEKPLVDADMDLYLNNVKEGLLAVEELNYEAGETSTSKIANKDCSTLEVSVPEYGMIQKYFTYKQDKYFVSAIVTSITGEEAIDNIVNCFE